jgi:cold shock CspA family protein
VSEPSDGAVPGAFSTDRRTGRVAEYDPARGWGTIVADDGEHLGFHCTQIADGSRSIPVGAVVRFARVAGHLGRWEAAEVVEAR